MAEVTVTVITRNEAAHIADCLASVAWADERLVVDSGSTDDTVALARAAGARVIERDWPGYAHQKNFAADAARHDWILSVDADERVTAELADEVRGLLAGEPEYAGYRIPRVTWHLGRWIWHTDWYPDPQLRLYDRRRARWQPTRVHESVKVDAGQRGPGRLRGHLQHYAYRDEAHHRETMARYTTLAAEDMHARGRTAGAIRLTVHPVAAFLRNYILKGGFLEGRAGLKISTANARYVYQKFAKLRALGRDDTAAPGGQAGHR